MPGARREHPKTNLGLAREPCWVFFLRVPRSNRRRRNDHNYSFKREAYTWGPNRIKALYFSPYSLRRSLKAMWVRLCAGIFLGSVLCCSSLSQAQSDLSLPGCEPATEVRRIMDEQLDPTVLNRMKFDERYAFEQQVLQDLIARYPRELAPYERL